MTILEGLYIVFASALTIYLFWHLFLRKDTRQTIYDSIDGTPKAADQLTPKEKIELDNYLLNISTDELSNIPVEPEKVAIPEIIEPAKEQIPTIKKESILLPRYELPKKAILSNLPLLNLMPPIKPAKEKPIVEPPIKPAKEKEKPAVLLPQKQVVKTAESEKAITHKIAEPPKEIIPKKSFQKEASKHGIKQFIFNCEGENITFTPKKIFRYERIDYTMAGIEGYLLTENHSVIYAIKYSDYFTAVLGNSEEVKIPTTVCNINSCDKLTIPDFKY